MNCSFCENTIEKGTGMIYVHRDGTINYFCSKKCEKNQLKLGRSKTVTKWSNRYHKEK